MNDNIRDFLWKQLKQEASICTEYYLSSETLKVCKCKDKYNQFNCSCCQVPKLSRNSFCKHFAIMEDLDKQFSHKEKKKESSLNKTQEEKEDERNYF